MKGTLGQQGSGILAAEAPETKFDRYLDRRALCHNTGGAQMAFEHSNMQVLNGLFDTLILGILQKRNDYGYRMLQAMTARLDKVGVVFHEGTLYNILHRLEAKGFVESYWRPGRRGTNRKYYHITQEGRLCLRERISAWKTVTNILRSTAFARK